jgi:cytochrome P450
MPQASQGERPGLQNLQWYRTMRDNDPVWQDPKTGLWNVFRYEDVTTILANYRTFSSDFRQLFPEQAELIEGNIVAADPPYHHQLRHLVSQAFTPRAIAHLQTRIEELTEELLDQAGGADPDRTGRGSRLSSAGDRNRRASGGARRGSLPLQDLG